MDKGEENKIATENRTNEREVAKASTPIPGLRVTNPEAWTAAMRDPATRKKAEDASQAFSMMNENLRRMRELRAEYGAELPGEVQAEYDGYKTLAIGGITSLGQTGVLELSFSDIMRRVGQSGQPVPAVARTRERISHVGARAGRAVSRSPDRPRPRAAARRGVAPPSRAPRAAQS
jgi:hypothetical protein